MIYEAFLPEFQEICRASTCIFEHPQSERILPKGSFNSNSGLIHSLRLGQMNAVTAHLGGKLLSYLGDGLGGKGAGGVYRRRSLGGGWWLLKKRV
jgi:hypothetical protein